MPNPEQPEPAPMLRNPPAPNPVVQQIAATGAAAGAAAGLTAARAAADYGSMGLTGVMRTFGNATAMLLIAVGLIIVYRDMRADTAYQRQQTATEAAALILAVGDLKNETQNNRQAIEALTTELKRQR